MDRLIHVIFWLFALLSPLNGVLTTVMFLIVVDFITGAYAAIKLHQPIKSEKIANTISKFFIYNLVIISAYFLEKHIVNEVPFLKIIAGFIAVTEIKSILENYNKIYGVNPLKALFKIVNQNGFNEAMGEIAEEEEKEKKEKV
ncbi:Bacteriophage holin family protein [Tenacibaculum sp. MAR_2009_124]|uniref:phage holin family protein n=1 Tax=Tenacibaculum sp. MAR_2009_124 TaxID=1250059 RepID=UPI000899F0C7|nr:phage holin family protein [Tenacibaculum sp. MAR_2009_124]SEC37425.1 Bacteriophage holin family protein [Tenacibaculum sp. MAR_2009_124]